MKRACLIIIFLACSWQSEAQESEKAFAFFQNGQYEKALNEFLIILTELESQDEMINSELYASYAFFSALCYEKIEDIEESIRFYEKSKRIFESLSLTDNEYYYLSLNNLALVYYKQGMLEASLQLLLDALDILKSKYDIITEQHILILEDVAWVYSDLDDFENSLKYYLILEELLLNKPDFENKLFQVIKNIAWLYSNKTVNYTGAENYSLKKIELSKGLFGKDHEEYIFALFDLADIYWKTRRYSDAADIFIQGLELYKDNIGKTEIYVLRLESLSLVYQAIEREIDAAHCLKNATQIQKEIGGVTDSLYVRLLSQSADIYYNIEDFSNAIPLLIESIELMPIVFGEDDERHIRSLNNLGTIYHKSGDYINAKKLFLEALRIRENSLNENILQYINLLSNTAGLCQDMGDNEKAMQLYLVALELIETNLGRESSHYGLNLDKLSSLHINLGDFDEALSLKLEAIAILENSLGRNHPVFSTALNNLAVFYSDVGEFEKALSLFYEALELSENHYGKKHTDYSITLSNLALCYQKTGMFAKALSLYQESLEIIEKTLGRDHPSFGIQLGNLSSLYAELGDYNKALNYSKEALQNAEKTFGKEHYSYINRLNGLAIIYYDIGNLELAESLSLQALILAQTVLGEEHQISNTIRQNLASIYQDYGQNEKALYLYKESLLNKETTLGRNHPSFLTTLSNLGSLYQDMGQYEIALPILNEVLENTIRIFGKEHEIYAIRLSNLALLHHRMGKYDIAQSLFEESLKITISLDKNHPYYSTILNNYAQLLDDKGEHDLAISLMETTLIANIENLGKDHPSNLIYVHNLCVRYTLDEEYEKALLLLSTFHELFDQHQHQQRVYIEYLNNKGFLHFTLGNFRESEEIITKASHRLITDLQNNYAFMTENEKEQYFSTISVNFNSYHKIAYHICSEIPSIATMSYNNELVLKGARLHSSKLMRQQILKSVDKSLIELYENWLSLNTQLHQTKINPTTVSISKVDSLRNLINNMERRLINKSRHFSELKTSFEFDWTDVRESLKENEAAIEFINFRNLDFVSLTDSTFYCALVITKNSTYPQMIFLTEGAKLGESIPNSSYDNALEFNLAYQGIRASGLVYFNHAQYKGDKLYNLLWEPLEGLLKGIATIYYAPSGLLNAVAFSAISDPEGTLIMEKFNLVQLNSTRQIAIPKQPLHIVDAAIFGGIDYNKNIELELMAERKEQDDKIFVGSNSFHSPQNRLRSGFSYLEGSLRESQIINSFLQERYTTNIFTGSDASERAFKDLSGKSPSIIHIATHGFYLPDTISDRQRDRLMLTALGEDHFRFSDDPLMRSALVLAGANNTWEGNKLPLGSEDGILTAREVSNLNLSNTELVVLSACQTGLGDVKGTEGVSGLQRAFKMAGVRYIIMSLWSVPDKETAEFMETFYTNWLGGKPIHEAFQTTQKQMHARYPNEPYKWGAFVLVE